VRTGRCLRTLSEFSARIELQRHDPSRFLPSAVFRHGGQMKTGRDKKRRPTDRFSPGLMFVGPIPSPTHNYTVPYSYMLFLEPGRGTAGRPRFFPTSLVGQSNRENLACGESPVFLRRNRGAGTSKHSRGKKALACRSPCHCVGQLESSPAGRPFFSLQILIKPYSIVDAPVRARAVKFTSLRRLEDVVEPGHHIP